MPVFIKSVLSTDQVQSYVEALRDSAWADGRHSAGYLSEAVKNNVQLADDDPTARELGKQILAALERNGDFISAALPLKVFPPQFNRYQEGQAYGSHIDGAIRAVAGTHGRVRTDLSATLFLSAPETYGGGELVIRSSPTSIEEIKLPAGDMVVYSASTVHAIKPITRGERMAAFFWIQSMVRSDGQRSILYSLDSAIQSLARDYPSHDSLVEFAGIYHNLLRAWADT